MLNMIGAQSATVDDLSKRLVKVEGLLERQDLKKQQHNH